MATLWYTRLYSFSSHAPKYPFVNNPVVVAVFSRNLHVKFSRLCSRALTCSILSITGHSQLGGTVTEMIIIYWTT